nr:ATP-binding protein [Rhodoalgimonas zhirmunskyi]
MGSCVSADQLGLIELVLGEVLNNVVEHAYGPVTNGQIEVECALGEGALVFVVRDFGREMPEGQLPEGLPIDIHRLREEDLPEGGFGWFLVRALVRGLEYRREAGCNTLSFTIPIADCKRGGLRADPAQSSG